MTNEFTFKDYDDLTDGEIELVCTLKYPAQPEKGYVPMYGFDICLAGNPEPVGTIRLRIGDTEPAITYAGNIGYDVREEYRGRRYAAKACNLVKKVALEHGMKTCWITVNPDNKPSIRTCEIIGARFVEIIDVPEELRDYMHGETRMSRYRWDISPLD